MWWYWLIVLLLLLLMLLVELIGWLLNSIAAGAPVFIQMLLGFCLGCPFIGQGNAEVFGMPSNAWQCFRIGEAGYIAMERTGRWCPCVMDKREVCLHRLYAHEVVMMTRAVLLCCFMMMGDNVNITTVLMGADLPRGFILEWLHRLCQLLDELVRHEARAPRSKTARTKAPAPVLPPLASFYCCICNGKYILSQLLPPSSPPSREKGLWMTGPILTTVVTGIALAMLDVCLGLF